MTTTQATAGQELTATLRRYFSVGTRTRRYRMDEYGRRDLHAAMIEAIENAAQYPGYLQRTHAGRAARRLRRGAVLPQAR